MGFRENLQYLRASRGLTQERLAVLLGVSRQAISKWESDKAYPEMDKLAIICDLFDCTLDELVKGDLTGKTTNICPTNSQTDSSSGALERNQTADGWDRKKPEPRYPQVPADPQDFTGYDQHMRAFAWKIAAGVAVIVLGAGFAVLADALAAGPLRDLATFTPIALGVVAGLGFLVPAGIRHAAFQRQHPFVEDFYTPADRQRGVRELAVAIVGGIALILVGIVLLLLGQALSGQEDGWWTSTVLFGAAGGVFCFIWSGIRYWRLDVAGYNREREREREGEQDPEKRAEDAKLCRVCGIIMLIATIIVLTTLFLAAPWAAQSVTARYVLANFWIPWPIGALACGIATLALRKEK